MTNICHDFFLKMRRKKHEGTLLEKMEKKSFLFPSFAQQSGKAMTVKI